MKVGDKLLCKNNYVNNDNLILYYDINNYYKITEICDDFVKIETKNINAAMKAIFYINYADSFYIWDWFYKPTEIRQLKLNSI